MSEFSEDRLVLNSIVQLTTKALDQADGRNYFTLAAKLAECIALAEALLADIPD